MTTCTHQRECILGSLADEAILLTDIGEVVAKRWSDLPRHFPQIELDAFVVMPNHLHGIVIITDRGRSEAFADLSGDATWFSSANASPNGPARGTQPRSLSAVIQNFKSTSTFAVNRKNGTPGTPLWQRNFYEHVVRDERSLDAIRHYIQINPLMWSLDPDNPDSDSLVNSEVLQRYGLTKQEADLIAIYDNNHRARQE